MQDILINKLKFTTDLHNANFMIILDNVSTFSFNCVRRKAFVAVPCSCFQQTVFYSCSSTTTGLYSASFNVHEHTLYQPSLDTNLSCINNIIYFCISPCVCYFLILIWTCLVSSSGQNIIWKHEGWCCATSYRKVLHILAYIVQL